MADSDRESQVISFRIHKTKDKEAWDVYQKMIESGDNMNPRKIFTDLLARYGGVTPTMYRRKSRQVTMPHIRDMITDVIPGIVEEQLTIFGDDLLSHLVKFVQKRTIDDVRSGRVDPDDDEPFGDEGEHTAYTDNVLNGWLETQDD